RPGCRSTAEQRDERAPFHSITSFASASNLSGICKSSAVAVLRLITITGDSGLSFMQLRQDWRLHRYATGSRIERRMVALTVDRLEAPLDGGSYHVPTVALGRRPHPRTRRLPAHRQGVVQRLCSNGRSASASGDGRLHQSQEGTGPAL